MQSLHTSISTLTSHVTGLPSVRQVGHMIISGNHLLQTSGTFELHYLTPQIKAQKIIEELTSDAECVTKALGKTIFYFSLFNISSKSLGVPDCGFAIEFNYLPGQTFEKKTNKNIVVNIQLNVMSWISNMTELLDNILSG